MFCKYDYKLLILRSSDNQNYSFFKGANEVKIFQEAKGRWLRGCLFCVSDCGQTFLHQGTEVLSHLTREMFFSCRRRSGLSCHQ